MPAEPFVAPFRVIRVVRTADGFAVVGETQIGDLKSPVTWRVMTFAFEGRTPAEAEDAANAQAAEFAARVPPWFRGRAYVVDSDGNVTEIGRGPGGPPAP